MFKFLKKKWSFYGILLLGILLLTKESYGNAFNFYFWKDDWAWLWSANFNPADFYWTTVGGTWMIRTGVLMKPYVLFLHRIIQDNHRWQEIGFSLKFINSLLLFIFAKTLFKKNKIGLIAALLYASYSGGIESYTWHKLNALVTSFILLGFTFYYKFLETLRFRYFAYAYALFVFGFLTYMGRSAGCIPVAVFWGILEIIRKKTKKNKLKILYAMSAIVVPFIVLMGIVNKIQKHPENFLGNSLKEINLFFGIIGNLLKNPFIKIDELGYLAYIDRLGLILGYGLFVIGLILGLVYLKNKNQKVEQILFFIGWIYLFYFPNWIWGGGGVYTILGSGHRYLAIAGVGTILLWVLLLNNLKSKYLSLASICLIIFNLNYSKYLIGLENSVRNENLVKPIYKELHEAMKDDSDVQVVVIDTPNVLKSFVVGGWYPYTYAYYKGEPDLLKFPVVIAFWDTAVKWICSEGEERIQIAQAGGFGDNRNIKIHNTDHLYAWSLSEEGVLKDRTVSFREITSECQRKFKKNEEI